MKKKLVVLIVAAAMMFGAIAGAGAAPVLEQISAHLNWSIKFLVGGQEWEPKDGEGNKLAPITYNNTTYIPVRAVSEVLGTAIDWDGENQTILIGQRADSIPITAESIITGSSSQVTEDKQYTVQNGTDYESGVVVKNINSATKKFTIEPKGKYELAHLSVFSLNGEDRVEVQVQSTSGVMLKKVVLDEDNLSEVFEVEIGGYNDLVITATGVLGASEDIFITGHYN